MKQEQPERVGGKPMGIRIQPREIDVPPNNRLPGPDERESKESIPGHRAS